MKRKCGLLPQKKHLAVRIVDATYPPRLSSSLLYSSGTGKVVTAALAGQFEL